MRIIKDIRYSPIDDGYHIIDLYLPEGECKALLLYFHGGGLVEGSRDLDDMPCFFQNMTDAGLGVASAEYRMYPKAKYPEFIEDASKAVAYAKNELLSLADCEKLIVCGTSAGGYLTMMLCFDKAWLSVHGIMPSEIDGFIHDAGQPTVHFNVLKEMGLDSRLAIIDEKAPLYHVGKSDIPPMQFIISDDDIPGRLEETENMMDRIKRSGYDMSRVSLVKAHGKHVQYIKEADDVGDNRFAKIIIPFINGII